VKLRRGAWLLVLVIVLAAAACGGGERSQSTPPPAETAATESPSSPVERALAGLPDDEALYQQVVYGNLARLRRAYPDRHDFETALAAMWLPDALAGAASRTWSRRYGFDARTVQRFVAAGAHPLEVAVIGGSFDAAAVRQRLLELGYEARRGLLSRGADGSVDRGSPLGRLVRSSLARVAVTPDTLVAASTSALARATLARRTSLAGEADLRLAASALGTVTSAIVLPADRVPAPDGALVTPLTTRRASVVAVGLDDRGVSGHTLRFVLVYGSSADADAERARLAAGLPAAQLPSGSGTLASLLHRTSVAVVSGRALVVSGSVDDPGIARSLVESGVLGLLAGPRPSGEAS
jgi:hypothetical protein